VSPLIDDQHWQGNLSSISSVRTLVDFPWITDVWATGTTVLGNGESFAYHNDQVHWEPLYSLPNIGNISIVNSVATYEDYSNPHGGFSGSLVRAVGAYFDGTNYQVLNLDYTYPAISTPPHNTTSRYVQVTVEPTMQALGCAQRAAGDSGIIVLDYGAPRNWSAATPGATPTYGTELTNKKPTISLEQIQGLTVAFADGYAAPTCAPLTPLPNQTAIIVIGTTNDIEDATHVALNAGHGVAWGQLVDNVQATAVAKNYGQLEQFAGGMDIEPAWSNPTPVTDWYNGYLSVTNKPIYNYGSCDACDPSQGLEDFNWTPQDIYNLSWSISIQAQSLPQIYWYGQPSPIRGYMAAQAEQWRRISAYAYPSYTSIGFSGAMSEDIPTYSNSPKDAWTQLWQALNFDPTGRTAQDLNYVTQITLNH
jgi:hypothetical protein